MLWCVPYSVRVFLETVLQETESNRGGELIDKKVEGEGESD